ncbi:hypothetical protein DICPUDRAFT_149974 [Dictyostelium purpureum]|uniref:Uncharacterized protein n=1 Tax=Dictyostelium purpureum TaxID=5786 RepID=F0ZF49_DICPU|nr:uncharacterized protein DICPUDRAFT_149974 [Dictyostelium purpureum]EGC37389.1 hypothetical protein DICPUDRAFT_149974 [Dictyostelium purpureum]|eukprot:XP_003286042.1 hypothetical protein DICPUDRAFT_149974 [Dictyostelium purpureum]
MMEELRLKSHESTAKKKLTMSTETVNGLKINSAEFIFCDINITWGADKLDQLINKVLYRESKWVKILRGLENYKARMEREGTEPVWPEICSTIRRKDDKVELREAVNNKLEKAKSSANDKGKRFKGIKLIKTSARIKVPVEKDAKDYKEYMSNYRASMAMYFNTAQGMISTQMRLQVVDRYGRVVFDFRGINNQTVDLPYPMPLIDQLLNKAKNNRIQGNTKTIEEWAKVLRRSVEGDEFKEYLLKELSLLKLENERFRNQNYGFERRKKPLSEDVKFEGGFSMGFEKTWDLFEFQFRYHFGPRFDNTDLISSLKGDALIYLQRMDPNGNNSAEENLLQLRKQYQDLPRF